MTLEAPVRRNRLRSHPAARVGHASQPVRSQTILSVELSSPDGRTWHAIGGGDTLATALAFARESCPTDTTWQPVRWNHLYGD
jgi:hypothetical protein